MDTSIPQFKAGLIKALPKWKAEVSRALPEEFAGGLDAAMAAVKALLPTWLHSAVNVTYATVVAVRVAEQDTQASQAA